jgi:hypothetical protein
MGIRQQRRGRRTAVAMTAAIVLAACTTPTPAPATLAMDATGLGPCSVQWYISCNYGIRVEGPDGSDRRGSFAWDEGHASPGPEPAHGPNGPVASTGVIGDVPATLPPGTWTISFRLWYGSDAIQLVDVPGGTPRLREEDPFTAACSTLVDTTGVASVTLHVAFDVGACSVESVVETAEPGGPST